MPEEKDQSLTEEDIISEMRNPNILLFIFLEQMSFDEKCYHRNRIQKESNKGSPTAKTIRILSVLDYLIKLNQT